MEDQTIRPPTMFRDDSDSALKGIPPHKIQRENTISSADSIEVSDHAFSMPLPAKYSKSPPIERSESSLAMVSSRSISTLSKTMSFNPESMDPALIEELEKMQITKDHSLSVNVIEAKNLDINDQCNTFSVITVSNMEQAKTQTVRKNKNPLWNDDFTFNLKSELKETKVVVWEERRQGDRPLGVVKFSPETITADHQTHEDWFKLTPPDDESSVSGQLLLDLRYVCGETRDHLIVNVRKGKDLIPRDQRGTSDPYVVIHLLPDEDMKTTVKTKVAKQNLNPDFNEQFNFVIPIKDGEPKYSVLHISVWDWDRFLKDGFMGQAWVFLGHLKAEWNKPHDNEWVTLLPETKINPLAPIAEPARHNFSVHSYTSPTWCCVCEGLLWGAVRQGMKCKECGLNCHEKCVDHFPENCRGDKLKKFRKRFSFRKSTTLEKSQEYVIEVQDTILSNVFNELEQQHTDDTDNNGNSTGNTRGSSGELMGQVRVRYRYTEEPVFSADTYAPLADLLMKGELYLLWLLQAAVAQKQEIAQSLVSIFESRGQAVEFLRRMSSKEIMSTQDPNTIFRGNSLVTKAFDAYLKLHGMQYLQTIMQPVINDIANDPSSCELDPTRVTEKEAEKNVKTLTRHVNAVLDAIFKTIMDLPIVFKLIFCNLRTDILEKFPENKQVQYTGISGFLFLRFFCPAILGPQLFGMHEGLPSPKLNRDLTLVAKTIQNLANLQEFGGKEPYMSPMNKLILSRRWEMMEYLDAITLPILTVPPPLVLPDVNLEMARLFRFFTQALEKMSILHEDAMSEMPKSPKVTAESLLVNELKNVLTQLEKLHLKGRLKLASEQDLQRHRHRNTIQSAADGWKSRKLEECVASLRRLCAQLKAALVNSNSQVEDIISAANSLSVSVRQVFKLAQSQQEDEINLTRLTETTQQFKLGVRSLAQLTEEDFGERRGVCLNLINLIISIENTADSIRQEVKAHLLMKHAQTATRTFSKDGLM